MDLNDLEIYKLAVEVSDEAWEIYKNLILMLAVHYLK